MRPRLKILFTILLTALSLNTRAAHTHAQLLIAAETARPGDTILAGIHLEMTDGWHTYAPDPENSGHI